MFDQNNIIMMLAVIVSYACVAALGIIVGVQTKKTNREEYLDILYRMATEDRAAVRREVEEEGRDVDVDSWNEACTADYEK